MTGRAARAVLTATLVCMLAWARESRAAPPAESRSDTYWVVHGIGVGATGALALITGAAITPKPDDVRPLEKPVALPLSQGALVLDVIAPPVMWIGPSMTHEFVEASLTYGEAVFAAMTFNHLLGPAGLDSSSTLAFAAAYVGAATVDPRDEKVPGARRGDMRRVRDAFWGFELGMATFAAHLEVRSGRRGYPAAILGALVGTGIGVGVTALHRRDLTPPSPQWGWGLFAALPGLTLPLLFGPPDADPLLEASVHDLRLAPLWSSDSTKGLALSGRW
jgi:hypothetical protein